MSYPPPPGLSSYTKPKSKPSTLPARPPPSAVLAYNPPAAPGYGAPGAYQSSGFAPRSLGAPAAPAAYGAAPAYVAAPAYPAQPAYGAQGYEAYGAQPVVPQIRNPFPLPGQAPVAGAPRYDNAAEDPELAAQIAHWQTAYSKDGGTTSQYAGRPTYATNPNAPATSANSAPLGGASEATTPVDGKPAAGAKSKGDKKEVTVIRSGGGTQWSDPSLLEWDPSHFRIFVGNLAGEVTDESLLKAFSRWPSVQKARVVRDKRTTKSKGFGFVSFSDGDEFFQAAREMNGKYIGSHPVLIKRATTEIKPVVPKDDRRGKHGKGRYQKKDDDNKGNGAGGHGVKDGGVQKAGQKTKNGLKILG